MNKDRFTMRIFLFGVLFVSLLYSPFTLDLTLTPRFIVLSVLLLGVLGLVYKQGKRLNIRVDTVFLFYLAYVAWCVLSLSWAHNTSEALFESAKVVLSFLVFCFCCFFLKRDEAYFMNLLLRISVVLSFLILFVGAWQYVHADHDALEHLYQVTGLSSHKNLYASFLFLNSYFLLLGLLRLRGRWRRVALLALGITLLALFVLKTKAVWVGLLVAACTVGALQLFQSLKTRFRYGLVLSLLLCLIGTNVFFLAVLRPVVKKALSVNASENTSVLDRERLTIWDKTYDVIGKRPWLGTGMGNWQVFFPDATLSGLWRVEDLNVTFQRPHNDFLWILSETGLVGFNLFLLFLFSLLLLAIKTLRNQRGDSSRFGPVLAIAVVAGYFTASFFDFPKERIEHLVWINLVLGYLYYYVRQNNTLVTVFTLPDRKPLRVAALYLLGFIAIIGIFRHQGEYHSRKITWGAGSYDQVISAGESAMSFAYTLDPTSVPVCWYMGNAYAGQGIYSQAHRQFKEAYRLHPYNRNVLNDLGSSYIIQSDTASAKALYLEAIRISPRFDDAKLNLVAVYIGEKDFKKASECLKTLLHDSERRTQYQKMVDAFL
jgi:O-antigen ligase